MELHSPHAVTAPKDCGLPHEPLVLRNLILGLAVDSRCHLLVHVLLVGERLHQVSLPRQPCQHPCLDLRGVSVNDLVTCGRDDRLLQLVGVSASARQVLQVDLVVPTESTRVRGVVLYGNRELAS